VQLTPAATATPKPEETGLGAKVAITRFLQAARDVKKNWTALGTASKRAKALGKAANEELKKAGVPVCRIRVKRLGPNTAGELSFSRWRLDLDRSLFRKRTVSEEKLIEAATTVYHEARHAEQWFRMAQLLAARRKSTGYIKRKMSIPYRIARAAKRSPLPSTSPQRAAAGQWYKSVYGTKARHRSRVYSAMSKATKKVKRLKRILKRLDSRHKALVKRIKKLGLWADKAEKRAIQALIAYATVKRGAGKHYRKMKRYKRRTKRLKRLLSGAEKSAKKLLARIKKYKKARKKAEQQSATADAAYYALPEEADAYKLEARIEKINKALKKAAKKAAAAKAGAK
jgi:hypothetical protein